VNFLGVPLLEGGEFCDTCSQLREKVEAFDSFSEKCLHILDVQYCPYSPDDRCGSCREPITLDSLLGGCLEQFQTVYAHHCSITTSATASNDGSSWMNDVKMQFENEYVVAWLLCICLFFILTPCLCIYCFDHHKKDEIEDHFEREEDYWFHWKRMPLWRFKDNPLLEENVRSDIPLSEDSYLTRDSNHWTCCTRVAHDTHRVAHDIRTPRANTAKLFLDDHPYRPKGGLDFADHSSTMQDDFKRCPSYEDDGETIRSERFGGETFEGNSITQTSHEPRPALSLLPEQYQQLKRGIRMTSPRSHPTSPRPHPTSPRSHPTSPMLSTPGFSPRVDCIRFHE